MIFYRTLMKYRFYNHYSKDFHPNLYHWKIQHIGRFFVTIQENTNKYNSIENGMKLCINLIT